MEIFSTNFLNLLTKFKIMFYYLNKKKRILLQDQEGSEISSLYGRHERRGSLVAQPTWLIL